jgi:glutamate-1-semialdehyde 2,1-aminomutase
LVQQGWSQIATESGVDISIAGIKPASHFVFNYENALALKALFIRLMLSRGFLASNLLYVMYAHSRLHVEQYLAAVEEVFSEIKDAIDNEQVDALIENQPASSGFKRLA